MTAFAPPPTPKPTTEQIHLQTPPAEEALVAAILALLVLKLATPDLVAKLQALLDIHSIEVDRPVVEAALGLAGRGTVTRPNARLQAHGIVSGDKAAELPRAVASQEAGYRAAYLLNAVQRLQRDVDEGSSLPAAIRAESGNFNAHERARRNRLDCAARVARAAAAFGNILGWYRNPESNSEAECLLADGHNFDADEGTVIGYPGSVHPECACEPGPPHEPIETTKTVNDVIRGTISLQNRRRRTALKPKVKERTA